ncbi:MAG: nucleoside hydrolase [Tenericutes bacterium]|jgi:ribosylpyrimidine nucleosidase|nr:nucleoside hydrolase [Mycoplasmatota bacterium]
MKRKIILDCDPGHDDAIALMLAGYHKNIDLLGVTVVSGNQTLEKTGKNALNIVQYLDLDIPVSLGSSRPIIKEEEVCEVIHGESGLDGVDFPSLKLKYDERHAVNLMIDLLLESKEKVTVVTTGPMTNLALAIRINPEILSHIEEVVLMGGSYTNGNVSPAAEFNIYTDPEAAHIVFNSGVKVTMIGLDVTRKVLVLPKIVDRMSKINNRASRLFVDLMKVFNENQRKVFGFPGGPLHDPVTIAYLIDGNLLTINHMHCTIDISHGPSYGRTNCDVFDYQHEVKNTYVATDIDVEKFWNIIESTMKEGK